MNERLNRTSSSRKDLQYFTYLCIFYKITNIKMTDNGNLRIEK